MAFKPDKKESAPAPELDASILRQDGAALEKLSPTQQQRAEDSARVSALRTMNAVRMLGPVIAVVAAQGGTDEDQAHRFTRLMSSAHDLAQRAALLLGFAPEQEKDRWAVNVLERTFAESLSKNPSEPFSAEMLQVITRAAQARGTEMPPYQEINEEASLILARIQAAGPILRAQMVFDFARPREATMEQVLSFLDQEVVKAMDFLLDPATGNAERRTLFSVLSQEASQLMVEAWQHEATRAIAALKKKTPEERTAWKVANPQGLPIDTVLTRFQQNMDRLTKLTKQLRPATGKKASPRK